MAMKCSSCGGFLVYNPETSKLDCTSCSSSIDIKTYQTENNATVEKGQGYGYKTDVYRCKQCGAQLCAPEEQSVAYCLYCGGESTLFQKSQPTERPEKIIPFSISKNRVASLYKQKLSKYKFLPKEFSDSKFIEGFRGIYIPYWRTSVNVESTQMTLKGTKSYSRGNYDYYEEYKVRASVKGSVDSGTFDASETFDDTISGEIAPFKDRDFRVFKEAYTAGFYADKVTSDFEVYKPLASKNTIEQIGNQISVETNNVKYATSDIEKQIDCSNIKSQLMLFPIWFLTWKKDKRVAYSIMNGQTGKLYIDLPVNYSKFFMFVFLFTLIGFGLLNVLPVFFIPLQIASFSSICLIASIFLLKNEIKNIRIIEQHVFDYGYKSKEEKKENKSKTKKGISSFLSNVFNVIAVIGFLGMIILSFDLKDSNDLDVVFNILDFLIFVFAILLFIECSGVKQKIGIVIGIINLIVTYACSVLVKFNFPQDYWYYGIAGACLLTMIINCLTAIFYMNYFTTREVPNFFSREGADNGK